MVVVGDEVRAAISEGKPVVALESTIFSTLGLPAPANAEALHICLAAIRGKGAVPALTAVLDGTICAGVSEESHERVLNTSVKVAVICEEEYHRVLRLRLRKGCQKEQQLSQQVLLLPIVLGLTCSLLVG